MEQVGEAMWKSAPELEAELKQARGLAHLDNLYALSVFWQNAVYAEDYQASEEWPAVLRMTSYGEATLGSLGAFLDGISRPDTLLAYFVRFFHHDLFFDASTTDSTKVRAILQRELLQGRIRLPYLYGRVLYDRFNDSYCDTRTDHLMGADVERLLQGTPSGVYQVGTLVSGPLGILDSRERRFVPPTLSLPLWHCSDTGCSALHRVALIPPPVPLVEALSRIGKALADRFGPPSEWEQVLDWLHCGFVPQPARSYVDLPLLIADCILGGERTALVAGALTSGEGQLLRYSLAMPPR
jgi:hypothetical protein